MTEDLCDGHRNGREPWEADLFQGDYFSEELARYQPKKSTRRGNCPGSDLEACLLWLNPKSFAELPLEAGIASRPEIIQAYRNKIGRRLKEEITGLGLRDEITAEEYVLEVDRRLEGIYQTLFERYRNSPDFKLLMQYYSERQQIAKYLYRFLSSPDVPEECVRDDIISGIAGHVGECSVCSKEYARFVENSARNMLVERSPQVLGLGNNDAQYLALLKEAKRDADRNLLGLYEY